jgi:hypothetical protein
MAGFTQVNITITRPHELNMEVVRRAIGELTAEELIAVEGVSTSALITAQKQS